MNDLVIDVGMNDGQDTAFYLHKGYRVLSIEANPNLCDQVSERFKSEIATGQLIILNCAIADAAEQRDFYLNKTLDAWSSLDPEWGAKEGKFEVIKVQCERFDEILKKYGVPYYLKIDIEGADHEVLRQLKEMQEKPQFISVEEHSVEYFPLLWSLGYRGFKIFSQSSVPFLDYPDWKFSLGSSGPFGDDVPGRWLPFGDAIMDYMTNVRDCRNNELFSFGWFDIHATLTGHPLPNGFPYPSRRKSSKIRSALWRLKRSITHRD